MAKTAFGQRSLKRGGREDVGVMGVRRGMEWKERCGDDLLCLWWIQDILLSPNCMQRKVLEAAGTDTHEIIVQPSSCPHANQATL